MIESIKTGAIIALCGVIGMMSFFLHKKPSEVIKTKIVTQVVTKVETKIVTEVKYIEVKSNIKTNRTIDIVKKDGTTKHIVENQVDLSVTDSISNKNTSDTKKEVSTLHETDKTITKFNSNWIFGVNYEIHPLDIQTFSPSYSSILVGYRIFSPISIDASISGNLKRFSVGILFTP